MYIRLAASKTYGLATFWKLKKSTVITARKTNVISEKLKCILSYLSDAALQWHYDPAHPRFMLFDVFLHRSSYCLPVFPVCTEVTLLIFRIWLDFTMDHENIQCWLSKISLHWLGYSVHYAFSAAGIHLLSQIYWMRFIVTMKWHSFSIKIDASHFHHPNIGKKYSSAGIWYKKPRRSGECFYISLKI